MIMYFSVENFRSINEKQILDLTTKNIKVKPDNHFYCKSCDKNLLKSAVIYGANASGKSNVIRAFYTFHRLILNSTNINIGEKFNKDYYDPFVFDKKTISAPTWFKIAFIGNDNILYEYEIAYNNDAIIYEVLDYYPTGYKNNLFKRDRDNPVNLSKSFQDKRIEKKILKTHLFLTKSGNSGHKQMGEVLLNFQNFEIWNALNTGLINRLIKNIQKSFSDSNESYLKQKLNKLIKIADTQIENITINPIDETNFTFPKDIPDEIKDEIIERNRFRTQTYHKSFENKTYIKDKPIDFNEESSGTKILFALGGLIIKKLESGGVIFFDEFDNSLHPKLCRFLVRIFHHPKTNKNNAQLIIATHETSLLDKGLFKKEQIWFTEKNEFGSSELFSVKDFEGTREDVSFNEWYKHGKFGAQPDIKEMEFIFDE